MADETGALVRRGKQKRREGPRAPSRERGIVRYAALLEATEVLLNTSNPDEIGLYQIAGHAGVPPASVYHFFPTKEAAFDALAERLVVRLLEVHFEPTRARLIRNWTDLYRIDIDRARKFYNSYPPAAKLFYGGYVGVNARNIDLIATNKISVTAYDRLNRIFYMPYLKNPARLFELRLGILDSIWAASVRRHGYITDEFHEEAYEACVAYSRLYLPAHLEPRPMLIEAAERDESLVLPFEERAEPRKNDDNYETSSSS